MDRWVPNASSLITMATNQLIDSTLRVKDILSFQILNDNLPPNVFNQLVALPAPRDNDGPNYVGWRGTNTRQFTHNAYDLQRENTH